MSPREWTEQRREGYRRTVVTEMLLSIVQGRKDLAVRTMLATKTGETRHPAAHAVMLREMLDVLEAVAMRCPRELHQALDDVYGEYLVTAWPLDLMDDLLPEAEQ